MLNGTGAPADTLGHDGDFYIDTAADVLYGPKAGGTWPANGTALIGQQGAQGPAGPQGPQGPPGSGGVSSESDFNGITCTTDGGAAGTVTASTAGDNTVTLACGALPTDANCTHDNGVGQNYTDCNDLLGTPGDPGTYSSALVVNAAQAYEHAQPGQDLGRTAVLQGNFGTLVPPARPVTIGCDTGVSFPATTVETVIYEYVLHPTAAGPTYQLTSWDYADPNGSFLGDAGVGHVHKQTVSGFSYRSCPHVLVTPSAPL